jgi:hypothetical protein
MKSRFLSADILVILSISPIKQVIKDMILRHGSTSSIDNITISQLRQQSYESNDTDIYAMATAKCIFILPCTVCYNAIKLSSTCAAKTKQKKYSVLFWGYCNSEMDPRSFVYVTLHSPRTPLTVSLDHSRVPTETVSQLQLNFAFTKFILATVKFCTRLFPLLLSQKYESGYATERSWQIQLALHSKHFFILLTMEGTYELNKVQFNFRGYSTRKCNVIQQTGF